MVRCRGGKSACHVFVDNPAFFGWLTPNCSASIFAIGYGPRPQEPAIDGPQLSWADVHASCHSGQNCRL